MDGENYISSASKQFAYYKMLADKTITAVSEEHLDWRFNQESNSIAMIMQHISGNMLSRFTDFFTSDGEKEWRNRDQEFTESTTDIHHLISQWEKGWKVLLELLENLKEEDLSKIVYIRNEGHTVLEAINRQLPHYAYHIGQIIFIGKMILNTSWTSLSIPRGDSKVYNMGKFEQPKSKKHFTEEIMKKEFERKNLNKI